MRRAAGSCGRLLETAGFTIEHSEGRIYLWASTRDECRRVSVDWLAERGNSGRTGDFYGAGRADYVRVALTATDERIEAAVAGGSAD